MSTKIYDGLIAADRNPFRVQARIKEALEPLFIARFTKAREAAENQRGKPWDEAFPGLFPRTAPQHARWQAPIPDRAFNVAEQLYQLIDDLYQTPTHTFTELDFGYEAALIPNGRGISFSPLVLVFSERGGGDYRRALLEAGVVYEYGYWNNTDQPDEVTDQQWREREKAWDKLNAPRGDGLFIFQPSLFDCLYPAPVAGKDY